MQTSDYLGYEISFFKSDLFLCTYSKKIEIMAFIIRIWLFLQTVSP